MFQLMLSGFSLGCIYSLVALGYHITFITSKSLNFAQGSAMMLGAVSLLLLTEDMGLPIPIAIMGVLVILALFGVALERLAVRPFVQRNSVGWVLATLAVGIILENLVQLVFGKSPRGMSSSLVVDPIVIFGAGIYPLELLIPAVVFAIAVVARFAYSGTMIGRALRATAFDREAALAMGINVNRMVTLSYVLSSVLAAIGGILLAPLIGVSSHMGFLIGLKAFAVAIVAGLGNPAGILITGILYGIMENLVGGMFGSSAKEIAGFGLVILVLFLQPAGLFSGATLRRI
ncbi:branched-chain amino acid ABC transporter permease [Aurantimonas sp. A2-1-M11]|uniref:branched-chain amino acid ABC transporter permease n=1 Tax=Aurantimonas sp. A2-1-M11 TaxID=3113712 RepID=UPI002F93A18D